MKNFLVKFTEKKVKVEYVPFLIVFLLLFPCITLLPWYDVCSLIECNYWDPTVVRSWYTARRLLGYTVIVFFPFVFLLLLSNILLSFLKKFPKYNVFISFSWLFYPFFVGFFGLAFDWYTSDILFDDNSDRTLFFLSSISFLSLLFWLLPIFISFIFYKKKRFDKSKHLANILKWFQYSFYFFIELYSFWTYSVVSILAIVSSTFKSLVLWLL